VLSLDAPPGGGVHGMSVHLAALAALRRVFGLTPVTGKAPMKPELIAALIPELFESERSAANHGRREARRWGDTPPGTALLAVAAHAETWLVRWRSLAAARDLNGAAWVRRLEKPSRSRVTGWRT